MGPFGLPELLIILLLILLFFGGKKLPDIARAIGKAVREFKRAGEKKNADPGNPGS